MTAIAVVKRLPWIVTNASKMKLLKKYIEVPYYRRVGPVTGLINSVLHATWDAALTDTRDRTVSFVSQTVDAYHDRDPNLQSIVWYILYREGNVHVHNMFGLTMEDFHILYPTRSLIAYKQWNYSKTPILADTLLTNDVFSEENDALTQFAYVEHELAYCPNPSNYQYAYVRYATHGEYLILNLMRVINLTNTSNLIYIAFLNEIKHIDNHSLDDISSLDEIIEKISAQIGVPKYRCSGQLTIDFY